MTAMEFRVLGPMEVIGPQGRIDIASARQRAVLAVLVLHAGETVSTNWLIDEVWGDKPPPSAQHGLGVHVAGLRRALGSDWIETQPNGYRLRAVGSDVDFRTFEGLVAGADRASADHDPAAAAAGYRAALALWRGPALGDLAAGPTAQADRTRLDELRTLALERRIDADLACGRHMDVIPDLRRITAEMPLREAFQARLMLALYRSGRQSEALAVYHHAREALDRELGVEPGQQLEAIQRAILTHDPTLDPEATVGPRWPSEQPAAAQVSSGPEAAIHDIWLPSPGLEHVEPKPGHDGGGAARPPQSVRAQGDTRRTVTTLMADVSGSTLTGEPLDPETARVARDRCFADMRALIERHGGTVEQVVGDAVMGVFGVPLVHEDDALRASRAALEMRSAVAALNDRLGADLGVRLTMRVGINTGEVIARRGSGSASLVTGEAVNLATRLGQASGPGEILLGSATYDVVQWAVDAEAADIIEMHGKRGSTRAFRLLALTADLSAHAQHFDSPLVGREHELRILDSAFNQAAAGETCQLFTLLGPAGMGKSRLVHEFLQSVRPEAEVIRGRCPPYGERVAFWPVAETIRQAAGIVDADSPAESRARIVAFLGGDLRAAAIADHVAALIGLSEATSSSEETFWAVRSVYEAIARTRPLVIVFDDVQWGEPSFLDLVEYLADTSRGAQILLLVIARPELLDERPTWAGGKLNAISVLLRPLTGADVSRLVRNLLGGSTAPEAIETKIAEAAEGNPLFVEEFLAMLLDHGLLRRHGDAWVASTNLLTIPTPPSITSLLAARLDRLPTGERDLLGRSAVVGKVFTRKAVEALVEQDALADVGRRLESLVHREVIRPDRSSPQGTESYRFKHILIRDAAYVALPKHERVVLHERLADWLAQTPQGEFHTVDEVIGSHLEQAYRYRIELGPLDDRAQTVGRMAAGRLADVGRRAHLSGHAGVAEEMLKRAAALLPVDDRERLLLLVDLTETLVERGKFDAAQRTNVELMTRADSAGFEDLRWRATLDKLEFDYYAAGMVLPHASDGIQAAIAFFEEVGDHRALGVAWSLVGELETVVGHLSRGQWANRRAVEHARRAGDIRREGRVLAEIAAADMYGPATVTVAMQTAVGLLDWAKAWGHLWTEAIALAHMARLKAMVGAFDEGRRLLNSAIAIQRDLGQPFVFAGDISRWTGLVEWLAGDPVAAEQGLRLGYEVLAQLGAEFYLPYLAGELARMLYIQNRLDEALEYSEVAAAALIVEPKVGGLGVRAMVIARQDEPSAAIELARQAVAIVENTDLIFYHARALQDLAEVWEVCGRPDEAGPVLDQAIEMYDRKGITVLAEQARARRAALVN